MICRHPLTPPDSGYLAVRPGLGIELRFFCRTRQGCRGGLPAFYGLGNGIEVTGTDFALMLDGREAQVGCRKFFLLQLDERAHLTACIAMRQFEHAVVQGMETSQRDELEF